MGELPPNLKQWMRFSPSDEKVIDLLRSKITGRNDDEVQFIFEAPNCGWDPWHLKDLCVLWDLYGMEYPEWWLFLPLDRNGERPKRTTKTGFWKMTAQSMEIKSETGLIIGKKNYLVFFTGGERTPWIMHEYCTTLKEHDGSPPGQFTSDGFEFIIPDNGAWGRVVVHQYFIPSEGFQNLGEGEAMEYLIEPSAAAPRPSISLGPSEGPMQNSRGGRRSGRGGGRMQGVMVGIDTSVAKVGTLREAVLRADAALGNWNCHNCG